MRASEALMVGAMLVKPMRGTLGHGNGNGCALTMIAEGGVKFSEQLHGHQVALPCGCFPGKTMTLDCAVMHMFDFHVDCPHYLDKSIDPHPFLRLFGVQPRLIDAVPTRPPFWTIEQIAQWLEQVEPRAEDKELRDLIQTIADEPINQALAADYVGYDSEGCYISAE